MGQSSRGAARGSALGAARKAAFEILLLLSAASVIVLGIGACSGRREAAGGKPIVVATIFPNYDFARQVALDRVEVKLLLPPGVEAHTYEPTPGDMILLGKAGMFIYTGEYMEPWAADLVKGVDNKKLIVVDASKGIALAAGHGHGEGEAHQSHGREFDPHIWLDPTLAARMVTTIADGLSTLDPKGADTFAKNAQGFRGKLLVLDARIESGLKGARRRTIVYGGHFAFGYFARRYGLQYVSPYAGFSPDSEPTPGAVTELIRTMKSTGSTTVFYEELLEPRVARSIAEATGARLELLHGAHNLTREELDKGVTYLSIMEDNLNKLRMALDAQ